MASASEWNVSVDREYMTAVLSSALQNAVQASKSPGAVALVGTAEETLFCGAVGFRTLIPTAQTADRETIYDLASLTKVLATSTGALFLWQEGALDLDESIFKYLPIPSFREITFRHLLTHTAGLPSSLPLYKETSSVTEMIQRISERGLDSQPGTRRRYSDLGFIVLGRAIELVTQNRLDVFCTEKIFRPLGMSSTGFNPSPELKHRCAATEQCPWRDKLLIGEVHDENAYAVGGVAGHAGLFSTVDDLARFCQALLHGKIFSSTTLGEMTRLGQVPYYPWQGLGWQLDPWGSGSEGYLPSRMAFGHSGWTGTSLWIDRKKGLFVILLSNTCHPSRKNRNNEELRRRFHDKVAELFYPDESAVHTGLDRLLRVEFAPLRGKRVALLTHHAAVDQLNRPIQEVFRFARDVSLRFLYSPEHGLRGQAEAGEPVKSEQGEIPIISLMGERKAPSQDELAQIDVLVVDLQDVGARYYTYAATMKACMEACRSARKPVLILDRPNPIGGTLVEGPVATKTGSPVCWGEVPVRHSMTMGEIALWFAKQSGEKQAVKVDVLSLDNWRRGLFFEACSLPWVAPSPNIPSPETALVYVGTCLFEAVNLNEGRGTDMPFQVIGAPWVSPEKVINAVSEQDREGCEMEPTEYVPKSIPGKASHPRYEGKACRGIHIRVTDRIAFRPFRVGVALLCAFKKVHPSEFAWDTAAFFDTLAGTDELRHSIERGETPSMIVASFEKDLERLVPLLPRLYS
ncbi:MAG TPA: DUF1343 domain-containing protein [Candidatus Hydrogenedentes bacterium]|nr:DUF1343 domain-containing protein [Candidatus Hydrogenedentota bacterium]